MRLSWWAGMLMIAVLGQSLTTYAADQGAYIVTRQSPVREEMDTHRISPQRSAVIVRRPVAYPEVVVPRALSEQPGRPWLIEIRVGGSTTVYIDPEANYTHQNPDPLDANQLIPRAQQVYRSHLGNRAYIVRGLKQKPETQEAEQATKEPTEVYILQKPITPPVLKDPKPDPAAPAPMPSVPAPSQGKAPPVA